MSFDRLLAVLLAFSVSSLVPLSGIAQVVPQASPGSVAFPVSTVRNISTIGAGAINPANVGRYAFAHAIGGNVVADAATGLPLPDGRTLPVVVKSSIPKAQATAAIGRFLRKGLPILGTGVALYDLAQELGFGLQTNGGNITVKETTKPPSGYDGYEYRQQSYWGAYKETKALACADYAAAYGMVCKNPASAIVGGTQHWFQISFANGTGVQDHFYTRRVDPTPFVPTTVDSTPEKFEQAINAKNDWQPSSALGRSLVDAIKAGELVQAPPQTVTGPASTPGPVSTTTDAVNNTTKTETTRYDHSYTGPTVTTTINTTTVTVDNSTGATISSTTTNFSPVMPETSPDEDTGTPTDTALPGQPELYTPEYPEGLKGVWNAKKAQLETLPILDLLDDFMPNVGASGTCPSWTIDMDMYIVDYGSHVIAVPCWVWDFGKVVIICSALLLSRRLIFGG